MAVPDPQVSDDARQAVTLLNRLADELRKRQQVVRQRLGYYEGKHQVHYASPEFRDYFAGRFEGFADNWCSPIIAGPTERMNVLGVRIDEDDRTADKELSRAWRAADCERGSSEAFVVGLAASRSYGLVWGNPRDEAKPRITWERPDQAIVGYDSDTGERSAALKLWIDDTREYATLYTPDHVWKFDRSRYTSGTYSVAGLIVPSEGLVNPGIGGWEPRQGASDDTWPLPNPMGAVPMVELRNQTLLDDNPLSDIAGAIAMQDAINLVWAYLLNALDFASLPQRVVMGTDVPRIPVLDTNGQKVGERPIELDSLINERILWIPGEGAKISQWSAADLSSYSSVIERAIEHIAAQTRTPPHYLIGKVANLSAEALASAETGLVAKTSERITYFQPGIREIFALTASAMGDDTKADACRSGTVMWKDIQHRALGQKVDALMKLKGMGFPMEWLAEQYGLEPPEVERVMRMVEEQAARDPMNQMMNGAPQESSAPATAQPGEDPFAVAPADASVQAGV